MDWSYLTLYKFKKSATLSVVDINDHNMVVELGFYAPPTAKVIWRRETLFQYSKYWRSPVFFLEGGIFVLNASLTFGP